MPETELKPCPFCGESAEHRSDFFSDAIEHWIVCDTCGARSSLEEEEVHVFSNWNHRPVEDALRAAITVLRTVNATLRGYLYEVQAEDVRLREAFAKANIKNDRLQDAMQMLLQYTGPDKNYDYHYYKMARDAARAAPEAPHA
jgi:Lar family restriction alleviation protein